MSKRCAGSLVVCGVIGWLGTVATAAADGARERPAFVCTTVDTPSGSGRAAADPPAGVQLSAAVPSIPVLPTIRVQGTAFTDDRWRPEHGLTPNSGVITLGVHFLNGSSAQRAFVRRVAPEWTTGALGRRLQLRFDVSRDRSDIRVRLDAGGDRSEVGRRNRDVPRGQATMTLTGANRRAVLHEFVHALGLRHEHHHPRNGIQWRESVVIAELRAYGWTEAMVRANVLDKFPAAAACRGDPEFNRNSIMIYPIQGRWTRDGFSTPTISTISARDRRCLEGLYAP